MNNSYYENANGFSINIDDRAVSIINDSKKEGESLINRFLDDSSNSFDEVKKVQEFGKSFNRVEKGYSEVNGTINNCVKCLNNYYDTFNNEERKFIDVVQTIKTPSSVGLNDFNAGFVQESIEMSKIDGTSVKEGTLVNKTNEIDEYNVNNQLLQDVLKEEPKEEVNYNDSSNIKTDNLSNINNDFKAEEKVYDGNSLVLKEILQDMNKETNLQEEIYNDMSSVQKEKIEDINNQRPLQEEVYDDSNTIKRVDFENINYEKENNNESEN